MADQDGKEYSLGNITATGSKLGEKYVEEIQEAIITEFQTFITKLKFKSWQLTETKLLNESIRFTITYTSDIIDQSFRASIQDHWSTRGVRITTKGSCDEVIIPFVQLLNKKESEITYKSWNKFDTWTIVFGILMIMLLLYMQVINKPDRYLSYSTIFGPDPIENPYAFQSAE